MLAPIVEIFCDIDDFCKDFYSKTNPKLLPNPNRKRNKTCRMSASEIITIVILFHLSHYRTFKDFYNACASRHLQIYFPRLVSYNRFLELKASIMLCLTAYLLSKSANKAGLYYVDSTPLKVCHNRRIYKHKTFRNIAARGKHSMGWFFGFKLHIVINIKGEIVSFCFTKGNVDDRVPLEKLFKDLKGMAAGDRGYISKKKAEKFKEQGLVFITKLKRNMKPQFISKFQKLFLSKRGVVETVIEQLKSICQIEHSRHRSPMNFIINLLSALAAYILRPRKPSVNFGKLIAKRAPLMSS